MNALATMIAAPWFLVATTVVLFLLWDVCQLYDACYKRFWGEALLWFTFSRLALLGSIRAIEESNSEAFVVVATTVVSCLYAASHSATFMGFAKGNAARGKNRPYLRAAGMTAPFLLFDASPFILTFAFTLAYSIILK